MSLIAQLVKNPPVMQETLVQFLGRNLPNFREIWPINWKRSAGEGIGYPLQCTWASLVAQLVKNVPALWGTWVWSLGWEDPLEKGKATHFGLLAWRIPWTV